MYLLVKFTDWNEKPWPLLPVVTQNVASWAKSEMPSFACRNNRKFWCRRNRPATLADSNDTHEQLGSPARTTQVAFPFTVAVLLDVTAAMTTLASFVLCSR